MAPLKTFFELSMKKDKDLKNLKIPVKGPKGTSKYMRMKVTNAPGASDIKKAVNSGFKTDANRKAAFAKMNDSTHSADKKPEKYIGPDGKTKIRMVAMDKEVVKKETLNKDDKPFVKKLVGKLRKGSKTHAKQADDLEKAMKTEASVLKPKSAMDIVKHARTLAKNPRDYAMNRKKYIDKARAKVFKMYPKETNEMIDPMDLRGRPKKKDPNPESPYGMKHPLHPVNLAKKKAKEAEKAKKEDVDIDEALTMTQRMKKSRLMKRLKSRIKIGRDRARRKMAKKDTLEKRSMRQARNQIASKLTRGIPKRELSFARKQEIEKRLDKPALKQRIKRLAKRLFKDVRKKEVQRKKG